MRAALTATNAALTKAKDTAKKTGSKTALGRVEKLEKKAAGQKAKLVTAKERLEKVQLRVSRVIGTEQA